LEKPLISVIIPAFNSELTIKGCISSIKSQQFPKEKFEIIVVDDESTDHTVQVAKEAGADKVITIQHSSSGTARNTGSKQARGKILAFIDSDCIAQDGWLKTIEKEFETNQVIGGPILNGKTNSIVAWAEYLMEFSDYNEHKKRSFVNFVPACNQACTKEIFEKIGGFREGTITEDVHLGHTLKKSGVKIVFVPQLQIQHLCGTKLNKYISKMEKLGTRLMVDINEIPSHYSKLVKNRLGMPMIFCIKFAARTRQAIHAKKFSKYIITLPLIVLGSAAFCRGIRKAVK
jgi:glycosyltransferase involved in cell wall biosynthesis